MYYNEYLKKYARLKVKESRWRQISAGKPLSRLLLLCLTKLTLNSKSASISNA